VESLGESVNVENSRTAYLAIITGDHSREERDTEGASVQRKKRQGLTSTGRAASGDLL